MNNFYVYEICSSENSFLPFYIGKGCEIRMYTHEKNASTYKCKNKHLQNKILKIKRNGFQIVYRKIGENLSEQDAFTIEKDMIAFNRSLGFKLCNHTDGGDGISKGHIPWNKGLHNCYSKEWLKNQSESHMNHIVTEETKRKQSESLKGKTVGKNNGMYGKNPWNKGIFTGPRSEESKRKQSESCKGKIPWNKGLKGCFSKETIEKMKCRIPWNKK